MTNPSLAQAAGTVNSLRIQLKKAIANEDQKVVTNDSLRASKLASELRAILVEVEELSERLQRL